jgi:RNA polymerase sigma factor (sigma-70 family)
MITSDDVALIHSAIAGDADALSALLRRHGPLLREQIRIDARWRSVFDIDDVLQVTYMEAFLKIESFTPGGPGAFPGWLKRIAENNLRDAIRALEAKRRPPPGKSLNASDDSIFALLDSAGVGRQTPSRDAALAEMKGVLESTLLAMPEDYAAVIRKYDLDGSAIDEVASAMGRTPGAVHMLRARAHERLRELLGTGSRFFSTPK